MRRALWIVAPLMIAAGMVDQTVWAGDLPVTGGRGPEDVRDAGSQALPLDVQRQAAPNTVGPLDYPPASPSDELRDGSGAPVQQLEESPLPAPSPLNDDNRG